MFTFPESVGQVYECLIKEKHTKEEQQEEEWHLLCQQQLQESMQASTSGGPTIGVIPPPGMEMVTTSLFPMTGTSIDVETIVSDTGEEPTTSTPTETASTTKKTVTPQKQETNATSALSTDKLYASLEKMSDSLEALEKGLFDCLI